MKCHECISFADGICRNPQSRRRDVGFFQEATIDQNTMNEHENKEENAAPVTYTCKGCGRELPPDQFYKNRWGLTSYCKDCMEKKKQTGTKSAAEKLEEMYLEMNAREIIAKIKNLSQELRRRGYEVTGTICTKIEI